MVGDTLVASHGWEHAGGDPHPYGLDVDGEIEVVPGAVPVLLAGGAAYRFKSGAPHRVSLVVEGTPQAVDLAGRVWTLLCGEPAVARSKPSSRPTCSDTSGAE